MEERVSYLWCGKKNVLHWKTTGKEESLALHGRAGKLQFCAVWYNWLQQTNPTFYCIQIKGYDLLFAEKIGRYTLI